MVREATNKVIELAEEGMISWSDLAVMALKWMPDDEVAEMIRANELDTEDYSDYSEDELRAMGCFDNLNEDEEDED